jgi:hypothetical protein
MKKRSKIDLKRKKGLIKYFLRNILYILYTSTIMKNLFVHVQLILYKLGVGGWWGWRFTVFVWQLKYNDDMSCTPLFAHHLEMENLLKQNPKKNMVYGTLYAV